MPRDRVRERKIEKERRRRRRKGEFCGFQLKTKLRRGRGRIERIQRGWEEAWRGQ